MLTLLVFYVIEDEHNVQSHVKESLLKRNPLEDASDLEAQRDEVRPKCNSHSPQGDYVPIDDADEPSSREDVLKSGGRIMAVR